MIVMTPVRNEAWVLPAFLKVTSQWADYIIIADQMSDDGSRELAKACDKVVLIDNKNPDFNEAERQSMLVAKAREVAAGRDCILFGLDADEVFAAGFEKTADWQRILNSVPGDVFWFRWAEISPDRKGYSQSGFFPWMFHDDGKEPHGNYVRPMHSMRIPYPIEEKQMYYVNDFHVLHLGHQNTRRGPSKGRFYRFVDWEVNRKPAIKIARLYGGGGTPRNFHQFELPPEWVQYDGFNLFDYVYPDTSVLYYDRYIVERLDKYPRRQVAKLDIYTPDFLESMHVKDPRNAIDKLVHKYIKATAKKRNTFLVRAVDKVLQYVY